LVSRFRADPINPPISNEARIASKVQPLGSDEIYRCDHMGAKALADPRIVMRPKTSVIKTLVRDGIRAPTNTPMVAPAMIVAIFTDVPNPTNIAVRIGDIIHRPCYKLP
jgi:hypothetical protein